jgi:hypothetical protein
MVSEDISMPPPTLPARAMYTFNGLIVDFEKVYSTLTSIC